MKINKSLAIIGVLLLVTLVGCKSGNEKPQQELSEDDAINVDAEFYKGTFIEGFIYNDYLRYSDYIGSKVKIVLDTIQIIDDTTYYCMDCNLHKYVINDKREDCSMKILEGDVIIVYGEYIGAKSYEMMSGLVEDVFTVDGEFIDLCDGFQTAQEYYDELNRQAFAAKMESMEEQEEERKSRLFAYREVELSKYIDYSAKEIISTFNMLDSSSSDYGIFDCDTGTQYGKYYYYGDDVDFVLDDKEVRSIILEDKIGTSIYITRNSIYGLKLDNIDISKWPNYKVLKEIVIKEDSDDEWQSSEIYRTYSVKNKYLLVQAEYSVAPDGETATNIYSIILTKDNPKIFDDKYFDSDNDIPEPSDVNNFFKGEGRQVENEDYILPDVDKRYYKKEELMSLDEEMLRLARNEVFARHHRKFETQDLKDYFEAKPWYQGYLSMEEFDDSVLNEYEKGNLDLLKEIEGISSGTFEPGWIYGTYECHDGIDAEAEIGWYSDSGEDYISLSGASKDGTGVGEFVGEVVSSKGGHYTAVDEYENVVDFFYNGIDSIEVSASGNIGGASFPGFGGVYKKTKDLSHNVS